MSRNNLIEYFQQNDRWVENEIHFYFQNQQRVNQGFYIKHYYHNDVRADDKVVTSASAEDIIRTDRKKRNIFHYLYSRSAYLQSSTNTALSSEQRPKFGGYNYGGQDSFHWLSQQADEKGLQFATIAEVGKQRLPAIGKVLINKLDGEQKFSALSARDDQGNTPLHNAIENCDDISYFIDLVQAIGQLDANQQETILTTANAKKQTILHLLAKKSFAANVLQQGQWQPSAMQPSLSATDKDGYTPIYSALLNQFTHPTQDRVNFVQGALTSLSEPIEQKEGKREEKKQETGQTDHKFNGEVKLDLLGGLADKNRGNYTLTSLTCRAGLDPVLKRLPAQYVQATANIKSRSSGMNAFHYAARSGNTKLMLELIKKFPPETDLTSLLMEKDKHGRTAFHHACNNTRAEMLSILLSRCTQQSWQIFVSLRDVLFKYAKNLDQGSVLNVTEAFNQHFGFQQVYSYLIERQKWLTRAEDYQQRVADFADILKQLSQGVSPKEIKSTQFFKKIHFCGLWAGSENYQTQKTQLLSSLDKLAEQKSERLEEEKSSQTRAGNSCQQLATQFLAFLQSQTSCPVAKEISATLARSTSQSQTAETAASESLTATA